MPTRLARSQKQPIRWPRWEATRRLGRRQTIAALRPASTQTSASSGQLAPAPLAPAPWNNAATDRATLGRRERIDRSAGRRRAAGEFCRSFGFRQIGRSDRDTKSDARGNRLAPGRRAHRLLFGAIPAHRKAIAGTRRDVLSARNVGTERRSIPLLLQGRAGWRRRLRPQSRLPGDGCRSVAGDDECVGAGRGFSLPATPFSFSGGTQR